MLSEFLEDFREEILVLADERSLKLAGNLPSSRDLKRGMPLFYQNLIDFLKQPGVATVRQQVAESAAKHGKELLRLNYTLSHVVHAYGAMCQAITELAHSRKARISSLDFNNLNLCLDIAIAAAVSEFEFVSAREVHDREIRNLGSLVHELRNALSSATVAHDMIKQGLVGAGGSTSKVLEENLDRMRWLIDRALSEVRLRTDPEIHVQKFSFTAMVDQIVVTARRDAGAKSQKLVCEMEDGMEIHSDRQLLLSAVANLLQNAIKYSKPGAHILLNAKFVKDGLIFKVQDECGGIKPSILKNLFKPFVSGEGNHDGLGLGLSIVSRSVSMIKGKILVENLPGEGCVFVLQIPRAIAVPRTTVSGANSVQPVSKKS